MAEDMQDEPTTSLRSFATSEDVITSSDKTWKLDGDRLTIGRDDLSDILLDEPTVSRYHAVILRQGQSWVIIDQASANGTFVNGTKVQQMALSAGDRIAVGKEELLFNPNGAAPAPPVPSSHGVRYDIQSQSGISNNVAGSQTNNVSHGSLHFIASRRGTARRLIISGLVVFFAGQASGVTGVLLFQRTIFNAISSDSSQPPAIPSAFFPLFVLGVALVLCGAGLFISGLVTRSGARREAVRAGVEW